MIQLKKSRAKKVNFPFSDLYEDFFVNDRVYTHDAEVLRQHPHYAEYVEDVKKFLKDYGKK